ncbi:MAG: hypothetical protein WDN45_14265 [Caulobacteraceae bacterium]
MFKALALGANAVALGTAGHVRPGAWAGRRASRASTTRSRPSWCRPCRPRAAGKIGDITRAYIRPAPDGRGVTQALPPMIACA